jgi:radical SAM protein with 4Fe4S-binding SPASM domain
MQIATSAFFYYQNLITMPLMLPAETVMIERDGQFLFLIPSKTDWVVTNSNGAYILSLCNGRNTNNEILNVIRGKGLEVDKASEFLERLSRDNFFSGIGTDTKIVEQHTPRLYSVHINMFPDCNLECRHCYAEEREKRGVTLTYEEHIKLIDDLTELSPHLRIEFTGGEPLLNKRTPAISKYARSKGHHTTLLTNGTPINSKNVNEISNSFDTIRISIDGSTKEINDFHRGDGTHKKINEAIRLLDECGAQLTLAMTVTRQNISDIGEMAKKYGKRLTFQPLFDAGNAKLNREMAITGNEYYQALSASENVAAMGNIGKTLNKLRNNGTTKCAIADSEISISHEGNVFPCHLVHSEEFNAGNIRDIPIREIYERSSPLNDLRKLHVNARPECSECAIRLLCGGSCRARALYLEGDINACDDFCDYEFSAFIDGIFKNANAQVEAI